MTNDPFADSIAKLIQEGKPPKPSRDRSRLRSWVVLGVCAVAASIALATFAQIIIH